MFSVLTVKSPKICKKKKKKKREKEQISLKNRYISYMKVLNFHVGMLLIRHTKNIFRILEILNSQTLNFLFTNNLKFVQSYIFNTNTERTGNGAPIMEESILQR